VPTGFRPVREALVRLPHAKSVSAREIYGLLVELDICISKGTRWFHASALANTSGRGWSHWAGNQRVTEWGGTLDAVRALLAAGESPVEPQIGGSLAWLKSVQRADGGWLSWEIRQSCVEVTTWVLIVLRDAGEQPDSQHVARGLEFLRHSRNDDGGWGAYGGAKSRVYPSLLATWALSSWRDSLAEEGGKWLIDAANADGGWGFHPRDGLSNIALTAMVVYALLQADLLPAGDLREKAIDWIWRHQQSSGLWEFVIEDWVNFQDPNTGEEFPTRTSHISSAWAIEALLKAGVPVTHRRLYRSIQALARSQETDGSWAFVSYDQNRHTWCAADAVCALAAARRALRAPELYLGAMSDGGNSPYQANRLVRFVLLVASANSVITLGILLHLIGALEPIVSGASSATSRIFTSLIEAVSPHAAAFIIATVSAIIAGIIVYRFTIGSSSRTVR
jgi:hypothetical protein